jgi:hypothetical protein
METVHMSDEDPCKKKSETQHCGNFDFFKKIFGGWDTLDISVMVMKAIVLVIAFASVVSGFQVPATLCLRSKSAIQAACRPRNLRGTKAVMYLGFHHHICY